MSKRTTARIVTIATLAALWALGPAAAYAQSDGDDQPEATEEEAAELGDAELRRLASGKCATPQEAWTQLIYWQYHADGGLDARATECFDDARLASDKESQRRARMFFETLDTRVGIIALEKIPDNPDHKNARGQNRYENPQTADSPLAGQVFVEKQPDGRWLFTADTLDAIPDLHPGGLTRSIEQYLPDWLKEPVLGITAWKYLAIVLLIFVAFTLQKITVFIVGRYVKRLVSRANLAYLVRAVERADRPIGGLTMALVFYLFIPMLILPVRVTAVFMVAVEALAAFSVVWLGYRLIDILAEFMGSKAAKTESKLDDQLVPLISKTLKVFVSVVGGIFILQNLDVNVGSLLAGLGLGGLAFALAARDTIANFFGSVMIFIDKPFQIGDWVVINEVEGIVEEVGFRTSRVRTFYNSLVTVPNAMVVNAMVDNYGARKYRRYLTTLGLAYDTPPEKVAAFCEGVRAIIRADKGMRHDYYVVEFSGFGDFALEVLVYSFTTAKNYNDEMRTKNNLNLAILRLADELGVAFAFPTQTLHIDTLAKSGESRPSHGGPSQRDELAAIIDGFGPEGSLSQPKGIMITEGYDCRSVLKKKGGDAGEGE